MGETLRIKVKDGYVRYDVAGKTVQVMVAPVLKRYRKVLEFDRETGDLLLEAEFRFGNGSVEVDEDPVWLNEILSWAFHDPGEVIRNITEIILE